MNNGYKMTELGEIPEDWEVRELISVASYVDYRGKTPPKVSKGVFLVTAKNIRSGKINYNLSREYVPKEMYSTIMSRGLPKIGDVLITTEAPLGEIAMVDNSNIALAQRVIKYRGQHEVLNNGYLKYALLSSYFQENLWKNSTGSTVKGIKGSKLHLQKILLPSVKEQEIIFAILQTLDNKIEVIDDQINKSNELKKGLIQRLLTKGIGHSEFRNSELGEVPRIWEVKSLKEVTLNYDSKRVPLKGEDRAVIQGEYPYYGAQGIIDYINRYIFDGEYLLVAEDGENVKSRKNDIAFIVKGKFWLNNHAHILSANELSILHYLKYVLNHISIVEYVTGQAQPKLNKSALESIKIPLPPRGEQQKIVDILMIVDEKIRVLVAKKTNYNVLKRGLMQQLLTGKMRVNHLIEKEVPT